MREPHADGVQCVAQAGRPVPTKPSRQLLQIAVDCRAKREIRAPLTNQKIVYYYTLYGALRGTLHISDNRTLRLVKKTISILVCGLVCKTYKEKCK